MGAMVFGPEWFFGNDTLIDGLSIFVLLLIGYFSFFVYKTKRNKSYLALTIGFALLTLSFILKICISLSAYFGLLPFDSLNKETLLIFPFDPLMSSLFLIYFAYELLALLGLYFLYSTYQRQSGASLILFSYLITAILFLGKLAGSLFHLSAAVLMAIVSFQAVQKYIKTKYPTSLLLSVSFAIVTISQLFFVFMYADLRYYVAGEIAQLIGYLMLLVTFIVVLLYGRKKNENRYYW